MAQATTHAETSKKAGDDDIETKAAKKDADKGCPDLDPAAEAVLQEATQRELEIIHHEWRLGVLKTVPPDKIMARLNELRAKG